MTADKVTIYFDGLPADVPTFKLAQECGVRPDDVDAALERMVALGLLTRRPDGAYTAISPEGSV